MKKSGAEQTTKGHKKRERNNLPLFSDYELKVIFCTLTQYSQLKTPVYPGQGLRENTVYLSSYNCNGGINESNNN